jgi:Zn-finger nucleic acid-binding protein
MTVEDLAGAEVDVCMSCGGAWVDWFDGEVKRVATAVVESESQRISRPSAAASSLRNEAFATGACPRCTRQLVVERYVVKADVQATAATADARTSVSQITGADLLRCEDCAGVFVSRASADLLATLPPDEEPPPSSVSWQPAGAPVLEPLPWEKIMAVVRRVLGL